MATKGVTVERSHPLRAEARPLLDAAAAELRRITGSDGRTSFGDWIDDADHIFLIASLEGEPAGCGGVRPLSPGVGEIKRLYAARPGAGIGEALLAGLEAAARARGYRALWVETRAVNDRAVRFYLRHGYAVRENYGRYVGQEDAVCFEKVLISPA